MGDRAASKTIVHIPGAVLRWLLSDRQRPLFERRIIRASRRLWRDPEAQSAGSIWHLWLFGFITIPLGFVLWNGQVSISALDQTP